MKRIAFTIALMCILSIAASAQRAVTIEYVDLDGNIRQVPALDSGRIVVFRSDGSAEVDLAYERGLLERASVRREDGSVAADILYNSSGNLQSLTARRVDGNAEAHIVYRNQELSDIASFRTDGSLEAIIGYTDGTLTHLSIADPDREQKQNDTQQTIEFFPTAQLRVTNKAVVCTQN